MDKHLIRGIYTDGNRTSTDILELLKYQSSIEIKTKYFDPEYKPSKMETPFEAIEYLNLQQTFDPSYQHLLNKISPTELTLEKYAMKLRMALLIYWQSVLVPNQKYIVFHSAGFDSRIISLTLKEFENLGNLNITKNIHFRCHQPEGLMFIEIMKRQKWHRSQYSVYNGPIEDYYDIGNSENILNGWQNYNHTMNFWSDIIAPGDEGNYIVINGLGGEIFKYTALAAKNPQIKQQYTTPKLCENQVLNMLINHYPDNGQWEGYYRRKFKNLLLPFFSYIYLSQSLQVNADYCQFDGEKDTVRSEIVKSYIKTNNIDCFNIPYGRHEYTWNLSNDRKKLIKNTFFNSQFYKKYKKNLPVSIDFTSNLYGWEAKIWSIMTIYEYFNG